MVKKDDVIRVLKQILDPEIQIDIWTMGLIYDIKIVEKDIVITMTLTTPTCPYGPMLLDEVKIRVQQETDATKVELDLVFDPPWQPSEELRAMLGV